MENYHYDGEGYLIEPTDGNTMIKEYNDRKAFTGCVLAGVVLVGLTLLTAVIYAVSVIMMNLIELITR